ncbi:MAG TPA: glutamine--tRNA ligase/YqeY domain fusion protein [Candidatus Izemoplasmatales bacterium]|nr:glutamine--tRNA ligase/YqeY domain fusion protein [Bacillota bacterium]HRY77976.1 glutamine--tRNA ligase/YqeY domain fusion protein [Candidatus Izemoplasmatales bacterium]
MEMASNFIKSIIEEDIASGKVREIVTRFPPEPNAYLHIGHARAIITDFEMARIFGGYTNLRFDDTNPVKEDAMFVEAIKEDIKWLGYTPKNVFFGSDYFEESYQRALLLIRKGLAYVDDQSPEEVSKHRGTLTEPGVESPCRNRSVEENLRLFQEMRDGKYADGEKTLRAKIDMASPNINMRDPVIYRILHITHHNTGDRWCIYPMYDFAHPLQDAIEGVTHSLCSLEYVDHRVLYDWFVEKCEMPHTPHQYEFGRLNITNTIMSKRYLRQLVDAKEVRGYDDPRMPTLVGLRRRGYTPEAIRTFVIGTGLSRINSTVSSEMLENCLRDDLRLKALRVNAVLNPLKVVIDNYPEGQTEWFDAPNNNENEALGLRKIPFEKVVYIERDDFAETAPDKHWKRLSLGLEVRLMHTYFIKCISVVKDQDGTPREIHCTYDPETKSGTGFTARKPNGNLHFVAAGQALPATFNLFEPLMVDSDGDRPLLERLNRDSWHVMNGFVEPSLKDVQSGDKFQFVRNGYFSVDYDSRPGALVFNRIVELKSSFK